MTPEDEAESKARAEMMHRAGVPVEFVAVKIDEIGSLRDELARLTAELDRWRDSNNRLRAEAEHQARRANESAEAEACLVEIRALLPAEWAGVEIVKCVMDLRLDRDRLDWMEANSANVEVDGNSGYDWRVFSDKTGVDVGAANLRSAIDAALECVKKTKS